MLKLLTGTALLLAGAQASAQDAYMSPMDFSTQTQVLTNNAIGNISVGETARGGSGRRGVVRRPGAGATGAGAMGFSPGARVSDANIPFASSAASQKQALSEYFARARSKNPEATADAQRAMAGINVSQRFTDAMRPLGLRANDAADVMTAFLMAGYEVMTGHEPTKGEIRGVRRQVAGQLVNAPQLRDPATRTKFGEELKIQFFVIGSGFATAQRNGNVNELRPGISRLYRQVTGQDISRWGLSNAGFVKR